MGHGEKCAGGLEDVIGLARLFILKLQLFEAFTFTARQAIMLTDIGLFTLDPLQQRLWHAANFGGSLLNVA